MHLREDYEDYADDDTYFRWVNSKLLLLHSLELLVTPEEGGRFVHGNATVTGDYIMRAAEIAQKDECGLVLLHSHPGAKGWQFMSAPDHDTESSYAGFASKALESGDFCISEGTL